MTEAAFPVRMRIDAGHPLGDLTPIWRFFGADEPNYATMPNGRRLLGSLGRLGPPTVYFRAHNLLTSGDGKPDLKWGSTGVYGEDPDGRPVYDWHILDGIFDAYREAHLRPYVEIGFMPEALSTKPRPYRHAWRPRDPYSSIFTGWAHPPADYGRWEELVHRWVLHCVERYGREEVRRWYWEVWNEADIGYWQGSPEEFLKLHDHAIAAVRRALPEAVVGGPDSAGSGDWLRMFVDHCLDGVNHATGERGTPLDFVAFHAKGEPVFVDGHVRMGMARHLRAIDQGFSVVASYPRLAGKPVILGESDPEGCAACQGEELGYRNGTMYSSYTAACFARTLELARLRGVNLAGALTWAFTFEGQPLFAGFRQLATDGIDLPVLNVFRMLSALTGRQLQVASTAALPLEAVMSRGVRQDPDVSALASRDGDRVAVLVWHYHDDDVAGLDAEIELTIEGLPGEAGWRPARIRHYRVDKDHGNTYEAWRGMGSPTRPTPPEYDRLRAAGELAQIPSPGLTHEAPGTAKLRFRLPRQGVSLVVVDRDAQ